MRTKIMTVTPELAKTWLTKRHPKQRNPTPATVERYKRAMTAGQWRLIPEPIAFNTDDLLIDGQQRLLAQVAVGITLSYNVSFDVEGDYDLPMNQGKSRTAEHRWGWPRGIASILRVLGSLEEGSPTQKTNMEDLPVIYERNRKALDWLHEEFYTTQRSAMSTPVIAAVAFTMPLQLEVVTGFAYGVKSGELLSVGDPALSLRNWVLQHAGKGGGQYKAALATANALRALLLGESINKIYTSPGGYHYLCMKRRMKKIPNTPKFDADGVRQIE